MPLEHHPLTKEFPDLHDQIHELKMSDRHFQRLMDDYESVDKEIYRHESNEQPAADDHINELRSRRVHLKDKIYNMLNKAGS